MGANRKGYSELVSVNERMYEFDLRTGKFDCNPSAEFEARKKIAQLKYLRDSSE